MSDLPQPPQPGAVPPIPGGAAYPLVFEVTYPERDLNRLTSALRIFTVIPIGIVLGLLERSYTWEAGSTGYRASVGVSAGAALFLPVLLMILFRQKYPRWWFDFNRELLRFSNRVFAYLFLLDDRYPSTDEQQYVALEVHYPDVPNELNRWLPIIKWLLAIPHYVVLFFLYIGLFFALIAAWFAVLFTGRYPRGIFDFVVGVMRWSNRVTAYAYLLVTDRYPPFRLAA